MVKCVLFDLDGTLLDTEPFNAMAKVHESFKRGYNVTLEEVIATFGQSHQLSSRYFKDKYGEDFPYDEISQKRFDYIIDDIKESGLPYKEYCLELIEYLKSKQILIGLCTSSTLFQINEYAKYGDLFDKFDVIITGDQVKEGKPSPEIFLKALDLLNVKVSDALVVEDSINGVKAAINANIDVIMVPDLVEPDDYILNNKIKVMKSLKQVKAYIQSDEYNIFIL